MKLNINKKCNFAFQILIFQDSMVIYPGPNGYN